MAPADASIAQNLSRELDLAGQLLVLLRAEESALVEKNIDALQATTHDKARLAREFALLRQQLLLALKQAGLPATDSSMNDWIGQQPDQAVQKNWQELLRLVASAQELNRANGALIQQLSVLNQAALSALQTPRRSDLYSPSGHNAGPTSLRGVIA